MKYSTSDDEFYLGELWSIRFYSVSINSSEIKTSGRITAMGLLRNPNKVQLFPPGRETILHYGLTEINCVENRKRIVNVHWRSASRRNSTTESSSHRDRMRDYFFFFLSVPRKLYSSARWRHISFEIKKKKIEKKRNF